MSHTPADSAIRVNKTLEEQLAGVTNSEQIKEIMKSAAISQNLAHREWDESILTPNEPGTAARGYAKTIVVNGVKTILESDSEVGLAQAETAFYRKTFGDATTQHTDPTRDAATGRFTAEKVVEAVEAAAADAAETERLAGLQLQMQLGQITVSEFLDQSGAIEKHIERQAMQNMESGWKSATDAFLVSDEGANWPGGDALTRIGEIIKAHGLEDAADKLDVLKQAWAIMQREDYESAVAKEIGKAQSSSELRSMIAHDGSSLFGR